MELCVFLLVFLVVLGLLAWFLSHAFDRTRIQEFIAARYGAPRDIRLIDKGKMWFGKDSERTYGVCYVDPDGNEHEATIKTSLWTGLTLTDENIVRFADQANKEAAAAKDKDLLEAENKHLRAEISKLKKEKDQPGDEREYFRDTN